MSNIKVNTNGIMRDEYIFKYGDNFQKKDSEIQNRQAVRTAYRTVTIF